MIAPLSPDFGAAGVGFRCWSDTRRRTTDSCGRLGVTSALTGDPGWCTTRRGRRAGPAGDERAIGRRRSTACARRHSGRLRRLGAARSEPRWTRSPTPGDGQIPISVGRASWREPGTSSSSWRWAQFGCRGVRAATTGRVMPIRVGTLGRSGRPCRSSWPTAVQSLCRSGRAVVALPRVTSYWRCWDPHSPSRPGGPGLGDQQRPSVATLIARVAHSRRGPVAPGQVSATSASQHRGEEAEPVGARAVSVLDGVLRVRHQADDVAALVA